MMNAQTGRMMSLAEHVQQSIHNILFTRIGTRIQREPYGSLLPELLDTPLSEATLLRCNAAVIMAIAKWEPRFEIEQAQTQAVRDQERINVQIQLRGRLGKQALNFVVKVPA
ncbi:GPW/gp25 family protein [Kingella kingae]|uniref:GPW/gp25 family protein n=1 Tax=Kingella kingae TaxID=504 RepID=UPI0002584578|nr:GPW/gp25 family protein [Kingella kingae]EIC14289.1 bacteriophage p2 baseplate assembly protein gpw [Kingella kingae PYKK081]MBD3614825.1 GPW/gp25 family protein [Kingella kingae]MBD3633180.1 GPW/gp25 family protein [Kingella kingae]MBD3660491.1 GPW/gp25 family protein [Kingella kingae]MDK4569308.1 GPW/gp25 family protein [Kingella kingae]